MENNKQLQDSYNQPIANSPAQQSTELAARNNNANHFFTPINKKSRSPAAFDRRVFSTYETRRYFGATVTQPNVNSGSNPHDLSILIEKRDGNTDNHSLRESFGIVTITKPTQATKEKETVVVGALLSFHQIWAPKLKLKIILNTDPNALELRQHPFFFDGILVLIPRQL